MIEHGAGGSVDDAPADADEGRADRSGRLAWWVFVAALVVAVPVIFHAAREQWFFLDEWDYLADRDLMSLDDLLRPHNEHWTTVPVVLYRLIWQAVGLNHYWPYLVPTVVAHLATAVLLRAVARRAGADPWVSTAAAALFAYLGSGWENFGWGFQITFTGALAAGVGAVVLADHGGGHRRRDAAAAGAAAVALACSGVGVVLLLALGVSVLIRRGPLPAIGVVALPAALYGAWTVGYGDASTRSAGSSWDLARDIALDTARALGPAGAVGLLVVAASAIGFALRVQGDGVARAREGLAAPIALLVGAGAFVGLAALGRGSFNPEAQSRYVHVVAALALPAVVLGLSELGRRWRPVGVLAVVVLVSGLVPNIRAMGPAPFTQGAPTEVAALAHAAAELPDDGVDTAVDPVLAPGVDVPWLRSIVAEGKVPEIDPASRARVPEIQLRLGFELLSDPVDATCEPLGQGGRTRLEAGDVIVVPAARAEVTVIDGRLPGGTSTTMSVQLGAVPGPGGAPELRFRRQGSPVSVQVRPVGAAGPPRVCRGA